MIMEIEQKRLGILLSLLQINDQDLWRKRMTYKEAINEIGWVKNNG